MTLNELSRYHWARMNQAYYMGAALDCHEQGKDLFMWECLLEWAYHMDIANEINDTHGFAEWLDVSAKAGGNLYGSMERM